MRRLAFTPMPAALAGAISVIGLFVLGFAVFVLLSGTPSNTPEPVGTLAPTSAGPAAPELSDVRVDVRTTSGKPVANAPVRLESRFAATEPTKKLTGQTDASGRFTFHGIDINPGSPWVAVAHFDDRDFPSSVLRSGRSVTITVAAVTFKADRIRVTAESLALVGDATGMQAVQAVTVADRSHLAFAGGLSFPLLDGATAIDPRTGLDRDLLELDKNNQMVSSAPLLPGSHEFTYTYVAPTERTIRIDVFYTTNRFDILVGGRLELRPDGKLHANGSIKLAGRSYRRYTAVHVVAGRQLTARVVVTKPSKAPRVALIVLAGLIALAIVLLPLLRRRRQAPEAAETPKEVQPEWT